MGPKRLSFIILNRLANDQTQVRPANVIKIRQEQQVKLICLSAINSTTLADGAASKQRQWKLRVGQRGVACPVLRALDETTS